MRTNSRRLYMLLLYASDVLRRVVWRRGGGGGLDHVAPSALGAAVLGELEAGVVEALALLLLGPLRSMSGSW